MKNKKLFIIIDGPMAGGKTSVSKILYKKFPRMAWVAIDRIKWFISDFDRYSSKDHEMMFGIILDLIKAYLKQNLSICLDQSFVPSRNIKPFLDLAKKENMNLFVYQVEADPAILFKRAVDRPKPDGAAKKPSKKHIQEYIGEYFSSKYGSARKVFDSEKMSSEEIADMICEDVRKKA